MRLVSKEQSFSSDIGEITAVLVMLSSDSPSSCYIFSNIKKEPVKLPPETLRDIFLWAASSDMRMPEFFFVAGANVPLEASIASVLDDMADQVITPLLPVDRQKALNIPFSENQMVIADTLEQLITNVEHISGRPVIVNIEQKEIDRLAKSILAIRVYIGNITIRLRDIHLLSDYDIKTYAQQFADITDVSFMKEATGGEDRLNVLNLDMSAEVSRNTRCPVGAGFVTIGPDARVYPCPAFYLAGEQYSIGTFKDVVEKPISVFRSQKLCGICNSSQCPGCFFLQSTNFAGKKQICKVYEAEKKTAREMLWRVAHSGYLFDCLRTLKTKECAVRSQAEGGETFFAGQPINSITFIEFTNALCDLKLAVESITGTSSQDSDYNSILDRWIELSEIPKTSQRNIFRRRMREILTDIQEFYIQSEQG